MTHYNIKLKSIDVNGEDIKLPTSILDFIKKQAVVVDSGTTLAYFPDEVYNQLMEKDRFQTRTSRSEEFISVSEAETKKLSSI
ncbi:putative aspartic peptidase A1 family, aspartic peptidase domain superfamily, xylanase inhibitor [Helianthus anomalus]